MVQATGSVRTPETSPIRCFQLSAVSESKQEWGARRLVCPRRIEVYSRLLGELMGAKFFGAAVKRREDPRFLRGEGRFVDDVTLPGMLHAAFVRSPHAHARIIRIHTTAAAAAPGVVRVLTFADLSAG